MYLIRINISIKIMENMNAKLHKLIKNSRIIKVIIQIIIIKGELKPIKIVTITIKGIL